MTYFIKMSASNASVTKSIMHKWLSAIREEEEEVNDPNMMVDQEPYPDYNSAYLQEMKIQNVIAMERLEEEKRLNSIMAVISSTLVFGAIIYGTRFVIGLKMIYNSR